MAAASASGTAARELVQECSRAMRGVKRKARREEQSLENRCRDDTMLIAAIISTLARSVDTAFWFLTWHSRSAYFSGQGNMTVNRAGLTRKLQVLQEGPAFEALLRDPQASLVHRAVQWIAEWNTFRWTFDLNVRGIAPSSSDIRDTYLVHVPEAMRVSLEEHMASLRTDAKTQKDWSAKYRRHWGLQYKKLGIGHDLTEDEIRARVPEKFPRMFFLCPDETPRNGGQLFPKVDPLFDEVYTQTADPKVAPDDPQKWAPKKNIRAQVSVWQRWVKWLKQVALADEDLVALCEGFEGSVLVWP